MLRLSIARSLALALAGLTLVLAVVAGLSVGSLYDARRDFEDRLAGTYAAEVATANLLAASVVEETVLRTPGTSAADRARARAAFGRATRAAQQATDRDAASASLVASIVGEERRARRSARRSARGGRRGLAAAPEIGRAFARGRRAAVRLVDRQAVLRGQAREEASRRSRRATIAAGVAGGLGVLGALMLVALLVSAMRRPLADLVGATRRLAAGDPSARVDPAGPAELRELASSFNTMASELDAARARVEAGRRRLAATIESLGDALVICDSRGRILEVNPRAADLVPELVPGHDTAADPGPLPELADALWREAIVAHRDRTLSITAARMGGAGEDGVVWTIRDVSERAQLERAKSDFVATASHELRSPLTSIKGFVELLAAGELPERQREFVDVILLSTNRLVELVNDLLDVARVEAGQLEVQRRPVALTEAAEEIAALMRARVDGKGQSLEVVAAPELPPALGDPARIRQILMNLVTNAHLYTADGGSIEIRLDSHDDWVTVSVADTGRGMSEEQRDRMFERFYRGEGSHSAPGTGLGMSIVHSLVDMHDGEIDVASEPGRGTTITVRLPRAQADGAADPREVVRGRRVLVVEDDPEAAEVIRRGLGASGVRADLEATVDEALRRLRAEAFDAVMVDLLVGDASGFDLLRALREDPELRSLPVVVVSALPSDRAVAGEWTVKRPIDAGELAGAIGSAILAGRARVLVVGRADLRDPVGALLEERNIEYVWATGAAAAARLCAEHRFEVALVDAGMRSPGTVLERIELRGRRLRRSVFVFSTGDERTRRHRLHPEPVPVAEAAQAVVEALSDDGAEGGAAAP